MVGLFSVQALGDIFKHCILVPTKSHQLNTRVVFKKLFSSLHYTFLVKISSRADILEPMHRIQNLVVYGGNYFLCET